MRFVTETIISCLAVNAVSLTIVGTVASFGVPMHAAHWAVTVICPTVCSLIMCPLFHLQQDKLRRLNTELSRAHHTLAWQVNHDALTGSLNRAAFLASVEESIMARAGIILLLDVDHFKSVNDRHGHHAGDMALQSLVRIMQAEIGAAGVIGRLGGEEFGIYLPGADLDQAEDIAERVRRTVAATPVETSHSQPFHMTVSVGAAAVTPGQRLPARMHLADQNLYQAKHDGRNRIVIGQAA